MYFVMLRLHQVYLFRLAHVYLNNAADADDALQEAAIVGYKSFGELRGGEAAFRNWMRRIVVNECLRIIRQRKRDVPMADVSLVMSDAAPATDPEAYDTWAAVRRLPDDLRVIVVLVFLQDMRYQDIAEQLNISVGTVSKRLKRGLVCLRELMEGGAAD